MQISLEIIFVLMEIGSISCSQKVNNDYAIGKRAIFQGHDAADKKYPFFFELELRTLEDFEAYYESERPSKCGATLIQNEILLTAAHCFRNKFSPTEILKGKPFVFIIMVRE